MRTPFTSSRAPALLAAVSLFLCGAASARAELLVKSGQKVAFLGDSITQFGWQQPGGYVKLVVSGLKTLGVEVTPIPAGVSGNTSRDMLARISGVLKQKPDWMTLSCGVNDVWHGERGVDLETYKVNIGKIIAQAEAEGTKVMVLTATMIHEKADDPLNGKLAAYNDFLRQMAKDGERPLVDLNADFWAAIKAQPDRHFTVDGVHMNPFGNRIMAEGILRGFGATDEDMAKVIAAWDHAPDGAFLAMNASFQAAAPLSFASYQELLDLAAARKINLSQVQTKVFVQALAAVMKAHEEDEAPDLGKLNADLSAEFARQLEAFLAAQKEKK